MKNLVLINGQINTMDPKRPYAEALAIKNGRICALGTNEEIRRVMPLDSEVLDAKGNSVFPGFIDTHVHLTQYGQNLTDIPLGKAGSSRELLELMVRGAETLDENDWVRGAGYNELTFEDKKLPDLKDADELFPERPIVMSRVDEHQLYLNTAAFRATGISEDEPGVVKDREGRFSGVIKDPANGIVRKILSERFMTDELRREYLMKGCMEALRNGTTSLCALEGGDLFGDKDVTAYLRFRDQLPIHTYLYHQTMNVRKAAEEGQRSVGGCIILDGSLGSHTAALFEDYADDPGCRGNLYYTQEEVDDFVMEAHMRGMQVSMHCIGDLAIETLLRAYEKALAKHPVKDHRHRLEHFSVPTMDQVRRAAALGCYIAVQPAYLAGAGMYLGRLGPERTERACMLRTLLDSGLMVGGGSDAPVTPVDPFSGIAWGMEHFNPKERISFEDGLRIITSDAARFTFEEKDKGSLEEGKLGDLAICDRNIQELDISDPSAVRDIKIQATAVEGEIRFMK